MSKYTTGELAKLCGVTVRTVQYYDTRGILTPSELTDGGRRLYSEQDLGKMKIVCFLRELGLPLDSISQMLSEEDPGSVIGLLLEQQEHALKEEIGERREKLEKLESLRRELKSADRVSVESIGDAAYTMNSKKKLKKIHLGLLLKALPVSLLQWAAIIVCIVFKIWWPIVVWAVICVPYLIWITKKYFDSVAYICPKCHTVFRPSLKEAFWANHTPSARRLTCTACGHKGFCVEVAAEENER